MRWYRDLSAVLSGEPENWLAYLHGQQMGSLPLLTAKIPRHRGLLLQIVKFGALLLKDFSFKQSRELKSGGKFFVFAGTANQMGALDPTIEALRQKGEKVVAVGSSRLLADCDNRKGYLAVKLLLVDVVQTLVLFSIRGFGLYRLLKSNHPVSVDWHFANFCSVYIYLCYFYRVFSQTKPEYVITANDHSIPSRCMLAVAHQIGIKSVYMQHASVSSLFPALRVTYAFLDGQCALDIYRQCEANQPDTVRNAPVPNVVLSGQKKYLKRSSISNSEGAVGIALNTLDDAQAGIFFINTLTCEGHNIRLRWHPRQSPIDVKMYREAFIGNELVALSDPRVEPISNFLEQINWVIAGNSSIHLEAALVGVIPIYFELTPADYPDYYGYLENGLCVSAGTPSEVLKLIEGTQDNRAVDVEAVRYYSATFNTEWEGREGQLVAECLRNLTNTNELPCEILDFHSITKA